MSKIWLKGETHSSEKDIDHEKEILKENNFEALVDEGSQSSYKINLDNFCYAIPIYLFFSIRSKSDQPHSKIHKIAKDQGTILKRTRENDLKIYEMTPNLIKIAFWCILLGFCSLIGILSVLVVPILLVVGLVPIFRCLNMKIRNQRIANKIHKAHESVSGDVLAIFGESHLEGVKENLEGMGIAPENMETERSKESSCMSKIMTYLCS